VRQLLFGAMRRGESCEPELRRGTDPDTVAANRRAGRQFLKLGWGRSHFRTVESPLSLSGLVITMWDRPCETSDMVRLGFQLPLLSAYALVKALTNDQPRLKRSSGGGIEKALLSRLDEWTYFYQQTIDVPMAGAMRFCMYSVTEQLGPGDFVVTEWEADEDMPGCDQVSPTRVPSTRADPLAKHVRVVRITEQGLKADVSVAAYHSYTGWGVGKMLQKGGMQLRTANQCNVFLVAELCARMMRPEVEPLLRSWTASAPIYSPYYPAGLETATRGKDATACHRVQLQAAGVDWEGWKPCSFDGGDGSYGVSLSSAVHHNHVPSFKAETVLPGVNAGTLRRALASPELQEIVHKDATFAIASEMDQQMRIMLRKSQVAANAADSGHFNSKSWRAKGNDLNSGMLPLTVFSSQLADGRHAVCLWRAKTPDDQTIPNFWEIWLIKQQGYDAHVSLVKYTRHTLEVHNDFIAGDKYPGASAMLFGSDPPPGSLAAASKLMAYKLGGQLLRLRAYLATSEGGALLATHAEGVGGQLMHGALSCVFQPCYWISRAWKPRTAHGYAHQEPR